jgi:G3E family GTPase
MIKRRDEEMKKKQVSYSELIRRNKEELMKDEARLEKIEKRIEDKYVASK